MRSARAAWSWCAVTLVSVMVLIGCGREGGSGKPGADGVDGTGGRGGGGGLRVVVTIPPLAAMAKPFVDGFSAEFVGGDGEDGGKEGKRGIGGMGGEVVVLIPPGASEHGFEIGPSGLAAIRHADVVVYVGFGLEPTVESVLARVGRESSGGGAGKGRGPIAVCFADVVQAAGLLGEVVHDGRAHVHADGVLCAHGHSGCAGEHSEHGAAAGWGGDPHLWLDPVMMRALAVAIGEAVAERAAMKGMDGEEARGLAERLTGELVAKIDELDSEYVQRLSGYPDRRIIVAHDAYRRWESRYGLTTVALHDVDARESTPGRIREATRVAGSDTKEGVMTIFSEPQLNASLVRRVARQTGARIGELDPLGGIGAGEDWFATMRRNLDVLEEALRALNPGHDRGG